MEESGIHYGMNGTALSYLLDVNELSTALFSAIY